VPDRWRIIAAPLDSAGADLGEVRAPRALLAAGLGYAIGTDDVQWIDTHIGSPSRDLATGVIGVGDLRRATGLVADAVRRTLDEGKRPLVLGGDCALLPGAIAGARRHHDDLVLTFVDGHLDVYDGRVSPTGEAADMDLAVLTGHGPPGLVPLGSPRPLLPAERIAAIGFRREAPPDILLGDGRLVGEADVVDPGVHLFDSATLLRDGPAATARAARAAIGPDKPMWLHLDVDVLDALAMPAVSYPQGGGPGIGDLGALLDALLRGCPPAGATITCFNPDHDHEGVLAHTLVGLLTRLSVRA
jgi:arginase